MVIAYHCVFSTYGFWLPNDPRGSNSDFVRAKHLLPYGPATKTNHNRSVANDPHDLEVRRLAKESLKYEPVTFGGRQALAVAHGFQIAIWKSGMIVVACAILPCHVHVVVLRHQYKVETLVRLLKSNATTQLLRENLHPFASVMLKDGAHPSPWGQGSRNVFINTDAQLLSKINYVATNLKKEGKRVQKWSFVTPYSGSY